MVTLTLKLPEDVFSALRRSPEEFMKELRFAAAAYWYSRGEVSQEKADRFCSRLGDQFHHPILKLGVQ